MKRLVASLVIAGLTVCVPMPVTAAHAQVEARGAIATPESNLPSSRAPAQQATTSQPVELSPGELAQRWVARGKERLVNRDTLRAYEMFQLASWLDRYNAEANFYVAVTRLLSYPMRRARLFRQAGLTDPDAGEELTSEDVNPLAWMAVFPEEVILPQQFQTGEQVQHFLMLNARRELLESLEALNRIPEEGFTSLLLVRNPLTGADDVDIDRADVDMFQAAIYATLAQVDLGRVYNLDVDIEALIEWAQTASHDLAEYLLGTYPELLRIRDADRGIMVKEDLIAAVDRYLAAEASMLAETDDQTNDLFAFSILPEDIRKERAFHEAALNLKQSLSGLSDPAWTLTLDQVLHLGDFFERPVDLRSLENGHGIQQMLLSHVRSQAHRALVNLEKATSDYSEIVDPAAYEFESDRVVEVDYGDLVAVKSFVESLDTAISLLNTYNADAEIEPLASKTAEGTLDVQQELDTHPEMLRVREASHLSEAKTIALQGLERAIDAIDYAQRADDADQADDVVPTDANALAALEFLRPQLEQFRDLVGVIDPHADVEADEIPADLNRLVDDARDMREFLPAFEGTRPVPGTMSDPTLGGMLPEATEQFWGFDE